MSKKNIERFSPKFKRDAVAVFTALTLLVPSVMTAACAPSSAAFSTEAVPQNTALVLSQEDIQAILSDKENAVQILNRIKITAAEQSLADNIFLNPDFLQTQDQIPAVKNYLLKTGAMNSILINLCFGLNTEYQADISSENFIPVSLKNLSWPELTKNYQTQKDLYLLISDNFLVQARLFHAWAPHESTAQSTLNARGFASADMANLTSSIYLAEGADVVQNLMTKTKLTEPEKEQVKKYQYARALKSQAMEILKEDVNHQSDYLARIPDEVMQSMNVLLSGATDRNSLAQRVNQIRTLLKESRTAQGFTSAMSEREIDVEMDRILSSVEAHGVSAGAKILLNFFKPAFTTWFSKAQALPAGAAEMESTRAINDILDTIDKTRGIASEAYAVPLQLQTLTTEIIQEGDKRALKIQFQAIVPGNNKNLQGQSQDQVKDIVHQVEIPGASLPNSEYAMRTGFFRTQNQKGEFFVIQGAVFEVMEKGGKKAYLVPFSGDMQRVFKTIANSADAFSLPETIALTYDKDGKLSFAGTPIIDEIEFKQKTLAVGNGLPLSVAVSATLNKLQNSDTGFEITGLPTKMQPQAELYWQFTRLGENAKVSLAFRDQSGKWVISPLKNLKNEPLQFAAGAIVPVVLDAETPLDFFLKSFASGDENLAALKVNDVIYVKLGKLGPDTFMVAGLDQTENAVSVGNRFTKGQFLADFIPLASTTFLVSLIPVSPPRIGFAGWPLDEGGAGGIVIKEGRIVAAGPGPTSLIHAEVKLPQTLGREMLQLDKYGTPLGDDLITSSGAGRMAQMIDQKITVSQSIRKYVDFYNKLPGQEFRINGQIVKFNKIETVNEKDGLLYLQKQYERVPKLDSFDMQEMLLPPEHAVVLLEDAMYFGALCYSGVMCRPLAINGPPPWESELHGLSILRSGTRPKQIYRMIVN